MRRLITRRSGRGTEQTLGLANTAVNLAGHLSHILRDGTMVIVTTEPTTERPRAILRVPRTALLGVFVFLVGTGPFVAANTARWSWLVLLPLLTGAWILRVQTTADAEGLVARSTFRRRAVAWAEMDGVRFPKRGWGRAVLHDGDEVWLPGVGFNDLRTLAVVSGGRVPDPFTAAQQNRAAREAAAAAGPDEPADPTPPSAPGLSW